MHVFYVLPTKQRLFEFPLLKRNNETANFVKPRLPLTITIWPGGT